MSPFTPPPWRQRMRGRDKVLGVVVGSLEGVGWVVEVGIVVVGR